MKLLLALLSLVAASVQAGLTELVQLKDIKADSELGRKLLSQARDLQNNNNNNYNNYQFNENWVSQYSIKFQGCHQISQWNGQADGEEDVRIATKRLVRFRLCPTGSCSSSSTQGCSGGYGDYIIDMDTFLASYFEAKATYEEFQCDYLTNYACNCNGDNDCLYSCYSDHNMQSVCMPNYNGGNNNANNAYANFDLEEYMQCNQIQLNNDDGNAYYAGPYCASQGGAIYLGLFTDDQCTSFPDSSGGRTTYKGLTGYDLPYGNTNIVEMDCLSCKEPSENNYDGNDAYDADDVAEVCENLYTYAGKCETNLPSGTVYSKNTNACNYMEGIKIVRKDGTVVTAEAKANKTASVFIGIFVVAFVLLSAYVYYLKTKLDRASISLSD